MSIINKLIIFFFIFLTFSKVCSESVNKLDFIWKDGLIYKKKSDIPFTGELIKKKDKGFFLNGKPEGKWLRYFDNGKIHIKYYYLNGKKNGLWETYYKHGQLRVKETWINGSRQGKFEYYYENGNLKIKGKYKNGKKEGSWEYYHPNGYIKERGNYIEGKKEGIWKLFFMNGNLRTIFTYKKNEIINSHSDIKTY